MSFAYHKEEKAQKPADIKKIVILGVGNLLLKDEGVGIHVLRALKDAPLPTDVDLELIDGGTSPNVFYLLEGADKLIIIDAVAGGSDPGSIYRFRANDIAVEGKHILSIHQIGLLEGLKMMEHMESKRKDVVIIGVEPKEIGWGLELSSDLQQKIPQIVEVVLQGITEEARKC